MPDIVSQAPVQSPSPGHKRKPDASRVSILVLTLSLSDYILVLTLSLSASHTAHTRQTLGILDKPREWQSEHSYIYLECIWFSLWTWCWGLSGSLWNNINHSDIRWYKIVSRWAKTLVYWMQLESDRVWAWIFTWDASGFLLIPGAGNCPGAC